ncbi:MAG: hypothetical protein QOK37_529 [Thermoanaerobaculia bacterium]|jgi:hypothetical protein|nr:hypothetical protein [Thermoanaerobaculia bacterium]
MVFQRMPQVGLALITLGFAQIAEAQYKQQTAPVLAQLTAPTVVALSSDGNTLAVGIQYANQGGTGTTLVFTRSGGVWTQQGNGLVGSGLGPQSFEGSDVALSSDGNTLAVGGRGDNNATGATWVFTRNAGVWTQQGSKLVGTGAAGTSEQGTSVALSSDGTTLAVGGFFDNNASGATWVFTRCAGVWTQQGAKLVGSGAIGNASQGYSVALSWDGNTLAVGGYFDNTETGATWVFTRSGGVWTQQGSKLIGTGSEGNSPEQGVSVALSSDGNTLAAGALNDNSATGATWVFTRVGGVWTQQGSKLVGSGAIGNANQGASVALTPDGNTLAVGGLQDNGGTGATWAFARSNGFWTQQGSKLVGTAVDGNKDQGSSVALSSDGKTLGVGAMGGGVYIFVPTPQPIPIFASCSGGSGPCTATANCPSGMGIVSGWSFYLVPDGGDAPYGVCGTASAACTAGANSCSTTTTTQGCPNAGWGTQSALVAISCSPQ